ncbi:MAG: hypothetical protein IM561_08940 [Microcystis sp. M60BS1]|uniref:hypothetical protein n=1 Tax=unclassified Microcystis TaxID=2643300 RepID=UPI00257B6C8D|nr:MULTISPECIES: hypothetical protein [unclassified Microcystis]MCA2594383.1 hypothetical protein [Microcystis sp. M38BS1]MCA6581493.1 hypothetical protein [Pseudanabaena sp. M34BS1SP1A06MG]MCA2510494.1 hypothetical protein [Microcystis sp. M60BS1]MCA2555780.1 hypothetical protein [Microcystis sp. M43BS1]MCA2589491.1 hypothetical protein [Microcystis sp. M31BS1]
MIEKTLLQIAIEAERELYQSAGVSVQVYAQDNLIQKIQNAFVMFFDDTTVTWKRFIEYQTYTLDGLTGRTIVPIKNIFKQYENIINIYPRASTTPLANWPGGNPSSVFGKTPLYITADSIDIAKVIPSTSSGQIVVEGKIFPTFPFNPNDIVPFDWLSLVYFIAWQYAVDDGSNPAGTEKLRQLFEQRYKQVKLNQSSKPVALNSDYRGVPTTWRDFE